MRLPEEGELARLFEVWISDRGRVVVEHKDGRVEIIEPNLLVRLVTAGSQWVYEAQPEIVP